MLISASLTVSLRPYICMAEILHMNGKVFILFFFNTSCILLWDKMVLLTVMDSTKAYVSSVLLAKLLMPDSAAWREESKRWMLTSSRGGYSFVAYFHSSSDSETLAFTGHVQDLLVALLTRSWSFPCLHEEYDQICLAGGAGEHFSQFLDTVGWCNIPQIDTFGCILFGSFCGFHANL